MNNRVGKAAALVAIAALGLTACGGSSGGSSGAAKDADISERYELDPNTPAWQLDNKDELTELTWYVNADWWNDEWGNDIVTKKIEEDLNIKVKFTKGDDTSLNTMFAGDNVTDMVTIFGMNSQVATRAPQWAYSLNDLADAYDPYWYQVAAQETMDWFQLEDGKTYGYPNYSNTFASYDLGELLGSSGFLIRKDIYEALGEPSFGTPEEFRASMQKIKAAYPDLDPFGFNNIGDGTGSLGEVLQNFLGVPIQTQDGEFYNRNLDPSYLTWIDTLREVHSDGNISDDSFADDDTAWQEKLGSGNYATVLISGLAQMGSRLQQWYQQDPDKQYIAIDGPQSTTGEAPKLGQSGISGWMINYVSKDAKDPAKAMQLFTYLQSEQGNILTTYGIEGETFEYNSEGKIELLPEVQKLKDENPEQFKKDYRLGEFIFFGNDKYLSMQANSMRTPALIQPQDWGADKLYPQFVLENTDPTAGTPQARNLTGINTEWATTLVSMIRAKSSDEMNSLLESYKSFLDNNGWDAIVEIKNEKMAENRDKLGLEN